jgi:type II secretory pathway pseudopilin PulG
MFVLMIVAIVSATTVPQVLVGRDRARAIAAAKYLAQQCGIARFQAVGKGRYVALRFTPAGGDHVAEMFIDGNRNGVRTTDITAGIDMPMRTGTALSSDYPGTRIAIDPSLGLGLDPIRLGGGMLLSFSPSGTATAGTVYVLGRDGTQLAVRVLGATARTRVLRYERTTSSWEQP